MTEPDAAVVDVEPVEVLVARAVMAKALINALTKTVKVTKLDLSPEFGKGDKRAGRDPRNDRTVGSVYRTDPEPTAYIRDQKVFDQYLREHYSDQFESVVEFGPEEEIAAVLHEHAPHLLVHRELPTKAVVDKVLALAVSHDIPGTARTSPEGVLTVKPNDYADRVVDELLAKSPITLELESGK